jgi:hypothetical protein
MSSSRVVLLFGALLLACGGATSQAPAASVAAAEPAPAPADRIECARVRAVHTRLPAASEPGRPDASTLAAFAAAHGDEVDAELARLHFRFEDLEASVRSSHILVRSDRDGPPGAIAAARARAEELLRRVRAGESFEAVARASSEDPGSAPSGGDLGWNPRGRLVEEFERAIFGARSVGVIPAVVETQFGFHVIRVDGMRAAGDVPEAEARLEVAESLLRAATLQATQDALAAQIIGEVRAGRQTPRLALEARFDPDDVADAELDPFGPADDLGAGLSAELTRSLFALRAGEVSEPVVAWDVLWIFTALGHEMWPRDEAHPSCRLPEPEDESVGDDTTELTPEQIQELIRRLQAQERE